MLPNIYFDSRPYLVGVLTPNSSLNEWRIVFWIAFGVFNVTNVIYVIWASAEVQPWNDGALLKKTNNGASAVEDSFEESPPKYMTELKRDSLNLK